MPRRPRPASRRPPQTLSLTTSKPEVLRVPPISSHRLHEVERKVNTPREHRDSESSSDPEESSEDEGVSGSSSKGSDEGSDHDHDDNEDVEYVDVDVDAARVSQWVGEEEVDNLSGEESDSVTSDAEEPTHLTSSQQDDFASLPFGTLRKAQRVLARASALSDSESDNGFEADGDGSEPELTTGRPDVKGKGKETDEPPKPKQEIPKRRNKHAPVEVSSKKPVPRKKLAVEGEKVVSRDPRFLPIAGEFSAKSFQSQYGFLSEMHTQEMKTLRENLKRARKLLATSPQNLREEREQEVQRLERAFKRAQSMVSKDRRERVEQEALDRVAKEEKEKRKEGKGAWFMKQSDKKDLLLRAKYEALAASGGRGAVKKAIEKKQKKVNQKEKKRRPYAPGQTGGASRKRPSAGEDGQRKRRRVG